MVEELHGAILDLKRTSGRFRFHRAEVVKKDFAVEIKNYYRQRDFDLVPVTFRQGHVGEQQWDPGFLLRSLILVTILGIQK